MLTQENREIQVTVVDEESGIELRHYVSPLVGMTLFEAVRSLKRGEQHALPCAPAHVFLYHYDPAPHSPERREFTSPVIQTGSFLFVFVIKGRDDDEEMILMNGADSQN